MQIIIRYYTDMEPLLLCLELEIHQGKKREREREKQILTLLIASMKNAFPSHLYATYLFYLQLSSKLGRLKSFVLIYFFPLHRFLTPKHVKTDIRHHFDLLISILYQVSIKFNGK